MCHTLSRQSHTHVHIMQEERESAGSYLAYGLDLDELTMLFNNLIIMEQNPKATDREGNPLVSYADVRKIDMGGQQALLMLPADDLQEFNRATQVHKLSDIRTKFICTCCSWVKQMCAASSQLQGHC